MNTIMETELFSAPTVVSSCIKANANTVAKIAKEVKSRGIYNIVTAGRGTSHHAAICFKVFAEVLAGMSVAHTNPSTNNVYKARIDLSKSLFVVVSQSGMSPDTINMLRGAKANGALTVGVTNNKDSVLYAEADYCLLLSAGEERAVAATKTFTTELVALLMLADALGGHNYDFNNIIKKLNNISVSLPGVARLSKVLEKESQVIVLSRGVTEGISRECGLKLTETTYKMTHTGSSNEFEHGPKALISDGTVVVMLAPNGEFTESFIESVKKFKKAGAYILSLTDINEVEKLSDVSFKMPECDFYEASVVYAFAIQAMACYTATGLGLNPDAPRNLNKVTITE
jgi:Glucosamine 6-phosphate synthetase, contains amidotransferase and phosphosugar isomerase domains